jgi:hypothetical protein
MDPSTVTSSYTLFAATISLETLAPKLQLLAAVALKGQPDACAISEPSNQPLNHRIFLIDGKFAVRLSKRSVPAEDLLEYPTTLVIVNSTISIGVHTLI